MRFPCCIYELSETRRHGHKAVLPRTWVQAALARLPPDPLVDQSLSYVLVEPLADLLQQVASQSNAGLCFGFCTIGGG
jgi:hypothetical protein